MGPMRTRRGDCHAGDLQVPENAVRVNGCNAVPGSDDGGIVLVYATFPDMDAARGVAAGLVGQGLAACVNLISGMRSVYRWDGAILEDGEVAGLIKTRAALAERVMGFVRVMHPYSVPALVVLPTAGGHAPFLEWIAAEPACALASRGEV